MHNPKATDTPQTIQKGTAQLANSPHSPTAPNAGALPEPTATLPTPKPGPAMLGAKTPQPTAPIASATKALGNYAQAKSPLDVSGTLAAGRSLLAAHPGVNTGKALLNSAHTNALVQPVKRPNLLADVKTASEEKQAAKPVKVPLLDVRQRSTWTCGPSALEAVTSKFGIPATEKQIVKLTDASPDYGTSPESLLEAAKKLGVRCFLKEQMTIEELKQYLDEGKAVICDIQAWGTPEEYAERDSGHYVVAIGYDDTHVYFEEPSIKGAIGELPNEEFKARWKDQEDIARGGEKTDQLGIVCWQDNEKSVPEELPNVEKISGFNLFQRKPLDNPLKKIARILLLLTMISKKFQRLEDNEKDAEVSSQEQNLDPQLKGALIGGGIGGLAGVLSAHPEEKKKKLTLRDILLPLLSSGALGAAGGYVIAGLPKDTKQAAVEVSRAEAFKRLEEFAHKEAEYSTEDSARASVRDQYPALLDQTEDVTSIFPMSPEAKRTREKREAHIDSDAANPLKDTSSTDLPANILGAPGMYSKAAAPINLTPQTQALHQDMANFNRSTPVTQPQQWTGNPQRAPDMTGTRQSLGPNLYNLNRPFGTDMTGTTNWRAAFNKMCADSYPDLMEKEALSANTVASMVDKRFQQLHAGQITPERMEASLDRAISWANRQSIEKKAVTAKKVMRALRNAGQRVIAGELPPERLDKAVLRAKRWIARPLSPEQERLAEKYRRESMDALWAGKEVPPIPDELRITPGAAGRNLRKVVQPSSTKIPPIDQLKSMPELAEAFTQYSSHPIPEIHEAVSPLDAAYNTQNHIVKVHPTQTAPLFHELGHATNMPDVPNSLRERQAEELRAWRRGSQIYRTLAQKMPEQFASTSEFLQNRRAPLESYNLSDLNQHLTGYENLLRAPAWAAREAMNALNDADISAGNTREAAQLWKVLKQRFQKFGQYAALIDDFDDENKIEKQAVGARSKLIARLANMPSVYQQSGAPIKPAFGVELAREAALAAGLGGKTPKEIAAIRRQPAKGAEQFYKQQEITDALKRVSSGARASEAALGLPHEQRSEALAEKATRGRLANILQIGGYLGPLGQMALEGAAEKAYPSTYRDNDPANSLNRFLAAATAGKKGWHSDTDAAKTISRILRGATPDEANSFLHKVHGLHNKQRELENTYLQHTVQQYDADERLAQQRRKSGERSTRKSVSQQLPEGPDIRYRGVSGAGGAFPAEGAATWVTPHVEATADYTSAPGLLYVTNEEQLRRAGPAAPRPHPHWSYDTRKESLENILRDMLSQGYSDKGLNSWAGTYEQVFTSPGRDMSGVSGYREFQAHPGAAPIRRKVLEGTPNDLLAGELRTAPAIPFKSPDFALPDWMRAAPLVRRRASLLQRLRNMFGKFGSYDALIDDFDDENKIEKQAVGAGRRFLARLLTAKGIPTKPHEIEKGPAGRATTKRTLEERSGALSDDQIRAEIPRIYAGLPKAEADFRAGAIAQNMYLAPLWPATTKSRNIPSWNAEKVLQMDQALKYLLVGNDIVKEKALKGLSARDKRFAPLDRTTTRWQREDAVNKLLSSLDQRWIDEDFKKYPDGTILSPDQKKSLLADRARRSAMKEKLRQLAPKMFQKENERILADLDARAQSGRHDAPKLFDPTAQPELAGGQPVTAYKGFLGDAPSLNIPEGDAVWYTGVPDIAHGYATGRSMTKSTGNNRYVSEAPVELLRAQGTASPSFTPHIMKDNRAEMLTDKFGPLVSKVPINALRTTLQKWLEGRDAVAAKKYHESQVQLGGHDRIRGANPFYERVFTHQPGLEGMAPGNVYKLLPSGRAAQLVKRLHMSELEDRGIQNPGELYPELVDKQATDKEAAPRYVKEMQKGKLSRDAVKRIAQSLPEGTFRTVKNLGRGQFNIADEIIGNIGGTADKMVRKLPAHAYVSPELAYAGLKDFVDEQNAKHPTETGAPAIAPFKEVGRRGAIQEFGDKPIWHDPAQHSRTDWDGSRYVLHHPELWRDVIDMHRLNLGPGGQVIDPTARDQSVGWSPDNAKRISGRTRSDNIPGGRDVLANTNWKEEVAKAQAEHQSNIRWQKQYADELRRGKELGARPWALQRTKDLLDNFTRRVRSSADALELVRAQQKENNKINTAARKFYHGPAEAREQFVDVLRSQAQPRAARNAPNALQALLNMLGGGAVASSGGAHIRATPGGHVAPPPGTVDPLISLKSVPEPSGVGSSWYHSSDPWWNVSDSSRPHSSDIPLRRPSSIFRSEQARQKADDFNWDVPLTPEPSKPKAPSAKPPLSISDALRDAGWPDAEPTPPGPKTKARERLKAKQEAWEAAHPEPSEFQRKEQAWKQRKREQLKDVRGVPPDEPQQPVRIMPAPGILQRLLGFFGKKADELYPELVDL